VGKGGQDDMPEGGGKNNEKGGNFCEGKKKSTPLNRMRGELCEGGVG